MHLPGDYLNLKMMGWACWIPGLGGTKWQQSREWQSRASREAGYLGTSLPSEIFGTAKVVMASFFRGAATTKAPCPHSLEEPMHLHGYPPHSASPSVCLSMTWGSLHFQGGNSNERLLSAFGREIVNWRRWMTPGLHMPTTRRWLPSLGCRGSPMEVTGSVGG